MPTTTERQTAIAAQLIERHGVLTKEMLAREEVTGGFTGLYPVLKAMEEAARVRRGYFVAGLGAAQFASPGAEDRLRDFRTAVDDEKQQAVVVAATDPANPWGNALSWPQTPDTARPQRVAGARVIIVNGQLAGYLNRSREQLTTFLPELREDHAKAATALAKAIAKMVRPGISVLLTKVDGKPPAESSLSAALLTAGFSSTAKGYLQTLQPHRG